MFRKVFNDSMVSRSVILLLILSFTVLSQFFCKSPEKVQDVNVYASLTDSVEYVGMNTCRDCHESIYNTFIETGMGKSFDLASTATSSATFDEDYNTVSDNYKDLHYQMSLKADSPYVLEFRLQGDDTVYSRLEKVHYIVGSGQHTNSHIMNTNGYLNQMPLTYYTQDGKWDLPPGFEDGGNTRFDRRIGLECMSCHNGYPEFVLGSTNKFTMLPNGIDCERCHGPGEIHVSKMLKGEVVDISKKIDYSIVNPSKLPIDLQFDICQRCHVQGNAILKEDRSFFDFRPAMSLSDVMDVYMPVYTGAESDHIMASHAERLKLSKCYSATMQELKDADTSAFTAEQRLRPYKNALTCITCHDPHVSSKVRSDQEFNAACISCHGNNVRSVCSEDKSVLEQNESNCINCHMPANNTLDIPHVTVHDHFIKVPVSIEKENAVKEFVGITAINNPDPSGKSKGKAFIAYYEKFGFADHVLDSAAKYFDEQIEEDMHQLIQIAYLRGNYNEVLRLVEGKNEILSRFDEMSYDNRDAWTSYRIGESYFGLSDLENALRFFANAYNLAPYDMKFANKYGVLLMQTKQYAAAREVFAGMISEYPKMPESWSNLGFLILQMDKDTAKALDHYERALALDPDYKAGLLNEIGLYVLRGDVSKVKDLLSKFLKKYPNDPQALILQQQMSNI